MYRRKHFSHYRNKSFSFLTKSIKRALALLKASQDHSLQYNIHHCTKAIQSSIPMIFMMPTGTIASLVWTDDKVLRDHIPAKLGTTESLLTVVSKVEYVSILIATITWNRFDIFFTNMGSLRIKQLRCCEKNHYLPPRWKASRPARIGNLCTWRKILQNESEKSHMWNSFISTRKKWIWGLH